MTQHTAGPWSVDARAGDITAPIPYKHEYFRDYIIATVHPDSVDDPEERVANAALLAAAPDLLEALEEIVSSMDAIMDAIASPSIQVGDDDFYALTQAKRAISRAKGGQ